MTKKGNITLHYNAQSEVQGQQTPTFLDKNTQNALIHPQLKSYSHRRRNDDGRRHIVGRPKPTVLTRYTLSLFVRRFSPSKRMVAHYARNPEVTEASNNFDQERLEHPTSPAFPAIAPPSFFCRTF
jgi:hypothetical protein